MLKPGRKNTEITEMFQKVASIFHCNVVEGVLSHQLKRFVIDGNNVIISKASTDQKVEEFTFQENEVYAIDIVMSTGDGKPKESGAARTTIYKRAIDQNYNLKLKAARYVLNEINQHFPTFPFTIRALDEKRGRLGIVECLNHGLVHPYPVLYDKTGEFVSQFKYTALVLPNNTVKLSNHSLPYVSSQYSITDPGLQAILSSSTSNTPAPSATQA